MKITKEHIEKLKQLDRIEYRQKRHNLYPLFEFGDCITIPMLCLMSSILIRIMGKVYEADVIDAATSIGNMGIALFVILVFVNLVSIFIGHKKLSELDNQYFKSEVKK